MGDGGFLWLVAVGRSEVDSCCGSEPAVSGGGGGNEEDEEDKEEDDKEDDDVVGRIPRWCSSLSGESTHVLMSGAASPPRTICRGWYMRRGVERRGRMGLVEKTTLSTGTPRVRLLCTALKTTATTSGLEKFRRHRRLRRREHARRNTMAMRHSCSSATTTPVNTSPPVVTLLKGPSPAPQ